MTDSRILIVDDDEALLEALPQALRLRMRGVEIDTAAAASEAIALVYETDYDAIVSDIKMPGMDGLALLSEIRALWPRTPTLLITGHGERDLAVQALRGGAYDFVQKPIDRDYFVASLRRAIEMRKLDREVEAQKLALERHARVLEHVGDGVLLIDFEGLIQFWNPAAEAITGLPRSAVHGKPAADVFGDWENLASLIPVAEAPGSATERTATVPVELKGRELWLSIAGVQFSDGTVYAFRSLTEERALDELKGEFVATVSHELRTPLAAIYGSAETLRRTDITLPDELREQLLATISQESKRLTQIVTDILLTTNLDSGRFHLVNEEVDLREVVHDVITSMSSRLDDKRLSVDVEAPPAVPPVAADPDKLRQVLVNLVDNAIKYSPEEGRIRVRVDVLEACCRVGIEDQGPGIPREEQKRVFGKFYRLDPLLSRGVGGTGVGLYISREIVNRMNGRIWVASEEGRGATFFIDLPLAAPGRWPHDGWHGNGDPEVAQPLGRTNA